MSEQQSMVAEVEDSVEERARPRIEGKQATKPKKQPRYHVVLWDDCDHTYEYVVLMMKDLFRHPIETGYQIAKQVDQSGKAVCLTTTMEHAELKRDQIRAFGKDQLVARCTGSMLATIEPAGE